jgi:tRNA (guanine37-N1)-methyltransferase
VADHLVDDEISIGDYILTNGVLGALVLTDAIARLIPGVLGDDQSAVSESFENSLLDHPHYTRPVEFQGWAVPPVLLSGNHGAIATWRSEQALEATKKRRPDLLG